MILELYTHNTCCHYFAVGGSDFVNVRDQIVQFQRGDISKTHTVAIVDDVECEIVPNEYFPSYITLDSRIPSITVTNPRATVVILDNDEPECGKQG